MSRSNKIVIALAVVSLVLFGFSVSIWVRLSSAKTDLAEAKTELRAKEKAAPEQESRSAAARSRFKKSQDRIGRQKALLQFEDRLRAELERADNRLMSTQGISFIQTPQFNTSPTEDVLTGPAGSVRSAYESAARKIKSLNEPGTLPEEASDSATQAQDDLARAATARAAGMDAFIASMESMYSMPSPFSAGDYEAVLGKYKEYGAKFQEAQDASSQATDNFNAARQELDLPPAPE